MYFKALPGCTRLLVSCVPRILSLPPLPSTVDVIALINCPVASRLRLIIELKAGSKRFALKTLTHDAGGI